MTFAYDLVIVGAGSAGMAAAEIAPRMGARVALIERARIGGDCLWTGCVPSKSLIAAARLAHRMRHADALGFEAAPPDIDSRRILARLRAVQGRIAAESDNAERFRRLGVTVLEGEATLDGPHGVRLGGRTLRARFILLATGSRPAIPPVQGLDEAGYLTTDTLFASDHLPASVLILGGGPVAVEMAQAMVRLGTAVTMLESLPRILPREEPELADRVRATLEGEGVRVHTGVAALRASADGEKSLSGTVAGVDGSWSAAEILLATGRTPNAERLGLDALGVAWDARGISVDTRLRTTVPSIFAAGDVAGRYLFTHSAVAEATVAVRNMFYPGSKAATTAIPWATFTDPELGHAGMTSIEARRALGDSGVLLFRASLGDSDRARAEGEDGAMLLVTDRRYRLLGAHILASGAGDMMGPLAAAIARRDRLTPDLASIVQVYPTNIFTLTQAAGEATYRQLRRPFLRTMRRLGGFVH